MRPKPSITRIKLFQAVEPFRIVVECEVEYVGYAAQLWPRAIYDARELERAVECPTNLIEQYPREAITNLYLECMDEYRSKHRLD